MVRAQDPHAIMLAAHKRLSRYRKTIKSEVPILDAQIELLRLAVLGMEHESFELSTLHNTYWMALHILGIERKAAK